MKAIEFEAEIQNGLIAIPDEYPEFSRGRVKVIVLQDEEKGLARRRALQLMDELSEIVQQAPELRNLTEEEINSIVNEIPREQQSRH